MSGALIWSLVYALVFVAVLIRVLWVEGKEPVSRVAWILVLLFLPAVGIVAYLLLGEPWVPRRLRRRAAAVGAELIDEKSATDTSAMDAAPDRFRSVLRTCEWLARGSVTGHNSATLAADSNAAIDSMVKDFDEARETIHISFYIWLTDNNGLKVVEALKRAAQRGVTCRVIADGIGSRALIRSEHWSAMREAGVGLCISMKVSFGLAFVLGSRVDLRNHRKIVVVDNRVTYCGSQNCADPEFRVKAKYAPWVDIMLRFEGPVARQNQLLFARDWMVEAGEDLTALMKRSSPEPTSEGFAAVAFGTGPISPRGAMTDAFINLLYCAECEVVISNPYFVPDPSLLGALICCARRGVRTMLILPARNDSWVVGAIGKAHYAQLVEAGVRLFEFRGGLLHAKTMVVDRTVTLVGSANMDRRSLELNFENNILLCSPEITDEIRRRQDTWLADSNEISPSSVMHRALPRRIGDNIATIFGPVM